MKAGTFVSAPPEHKLLSILVRTCTFAANPDRLDSGFLCAQFDVFVCLRVLGFVQSWLLLRTLS